MSRPPYDRLPNHYVRDLVYSKRHKGFEVVSPIYYPNWHAYDAGEGFAVSAPACDCGNGICTGRAGSVLVAKIVEGADVPLEFYRYPAEHWIHLRTTNPIELGIASRRNCHGLQSDRRRAG